MPMATGLVLCTLLAVSVVSAAPSPARQFRDGDVVCFVGDSITHSRKFHKYILDYYLTRFPERHIRFVNCGIAGDSARGAVARFAWDIEPHHPTLASIMLGMNDIGRGHYGKTSPDAPVLAAREVALAAHRLYMKKLAELLRDRSHAELIFVTPSPYDDTADLPEPNLFGCNDALGLCGAYGGELAAQFGGGQVDFHGPMTALNLEQQKRDPHFTLIGPDRVHPGDVGMLVMAYLYLKAQGVPGVVSRVQIDGVRGQAIAGSNATLTDVHVTPSTVEWDCLEGALPMPIEEAARPALELVPFISDLDREMLIVRLAQGGTYRLTIGALPVGDYTREQLAAGINLATNPTTPQYKQAARVTALNEQRRNLEIRLRSYAQMRCLLVGEKVDESNEAAVQAYFDKFLSQFPPGSGYRPYFSAQIKTYLAVKTTHSEIEAQIEALQQQLWVRNQPQKLHYALAAVAH
jgi:lysophospholipase L1-like esterase